MKIVFSPGGLEQPFGGVSRYVYRLTDEINRQGGSAHVSSPLIWNQYFRQGPKSNYRGLLSPRPSIGMGKMVRPFNRRTWQPLYGREQTDIFHLTYYFDKYNKIGLKPLVLTVYDMIHELFPEEFVDSAKLSQAKFNACERADHIITISNNTKNDLVRIFGVDSSKITTVPLAVGLPQIRQAPTNVENPFILYVGSRRGYKNFASLVEALSLVSSFMEGNLRLTVFGGGKPSRPELELLSAHGICRNKVRWVSGGDELLTSFYTKARALVYPSLYEGFGLPILEAMSLGCPVIAGNNSSIPEVTGPSGILVDSASPRKLADAITKVVESSETRETLVAAGFRRSQLFSWERVAEETVSIYERVLGLASPAKPS